MILRIGRARQRTDLRRLWKQGILRSTGNFTRPTKDKSDLCKILGVDEIVAGKVVLSQPWSLKSLQDYKEVRDYKVKATLNIYDAQNKLLWSFNNTVRDTISQSSITEKLMRKYEKK